MTLTRVMRVIALALMVSLAMSGAAAAAPGANSAEGRGDGSDGRGRSRAVKQLDDDGNVPSEWDIPKEKRWEAPAGYDKQPEVAGAPGDGRNSLSFRYFDDGDIIVSMESWSVGHAGIWDDRYDRGSYSYCVWSAVKSGRGCVLREQPIKYRTYDRAYGLWVPKASLSKRCAARSYAAAQNGERYDISSSKWDTSRWYCSKLVWAGYRFRAGIDLDGNGGFWVSPADLYSDRDTRVFASSN